MIKIILQNLIEFRSLKKRGQKRGGQKGGSKKGSKFEIRRFFDVFLKKGVQKGARGGGFFTIT